MISLKKYKKAKKKWFDTHIEYFSITSTICRSYIIVHKGNVICEYDENIDPETLSLLNYISMCDPHNIFFNTIKLRVSDSYFGGKFRITFRTENSKFKERMTKFFRKIELRNKRANY